MLAAIQLRLRDGVYTAGIFFLVLSLVIFCIPMATSSFSKDGGNFGFFVLNFAIAVVYYFVLLGNGRLKKKGRSIHTFFIFLLLFLISAYSLNREMSIFQDSATWFCIVLVIVSINYLAFSYLSSAPNWLRHTMTFVLGISTLTFIYLSFYLFPYYPVGLIASPLLGISLHTFVPILFAVYSIVLLRKIIIRYPALIKSYVVGLIAVIIPIIIFIIQ